MPVMNCSENNKPGYKYGQSGKCYTYTAGNRTSQAAAKLKAAAQGAVQHIRRKTD